MTCSIRRRHDAGPDRHFHFVFDCGSINKEHLRGSLDDINADILDILFISHLDADHVNCVDELLGRVSVEAVVLPCLDPLVTTAIVCESLTGGGMTEDFRSFLREPTAWLAKRGVKRVLYVSRDVDGEGAAPPFTPDDGPLGYGRALVEGGVDQGRFECNVKSMGEAAAPVRTRVGSAHVQIQVQVLSAACALDIDLGASDSSTYTRLAWLLIPYVHPFPREKIDAFRQAVRGVIDVPPGEALAGKKFVARLLDLLKSEKQRSVLKSCYSILSLDNNKPSLSLYSGPHPGQGEYWEVDDIRYARRYAFDRAASGIGAWMSTGDADLKSKGTRTPWLRMFGSLLDRVTVFVLPHHGSNRSIDDEILEGLADAVHVACAESGRSHHPHPDLTTRLEEQRIAFWQVSEDRNTALFLRVTGR